jgi:superfamily II DNA or RNA helicase
MIELEPQSPRASQLLAFSDGSLMLDGGQTPCPFFRLHGGKLRAMPINYKKVREWFASRGIALTDHADQTQPIDATLRTAYEDRPYQREAVEAWIEAGCAGCIVLPTGSGKTLVALRAIEHVGRSTLVVLPTLDLMNQWYEILTNAFCERVGILGGGYHDVKPLTVTTYDSAFRYVDLYGDRFGLLIFDEVHHLPSESYSQIAELSIAPHRLGLTATFYRTDRRQEALVQLVGPVVYERTIDEFKGNVLADFEIQRIWVDLNSEEKLAYEAKYSEYIGFVREQKISLYGKGWDRFIMKTADTPAARSALLAKVEAARIASQASGKFDVLELLMKLHAHDHVLIFTKDVALTYEIARRYLIPPITHYTDTKERKDILERFREGSYRMLVSSEVLNEGVDVPAANVAIILSGTASPVRHVQRLGRILRKKDENKAMLYEVISRGTKEHDVSRRRRTYGASPDKRV